MYYTKLKQGASGLQCCAPTWLNCGQVKSDVGSVFSRTKYRSPVTRSSGAAGNRTVFLTMDLSPIFFVTLSLAGASQAANSQQDAAIKELVERKCARCHTLVSTYRMRNTRERWAEIVDDMVSRGADATDEEIEQIIDFLATHYGPKVNLNKATAGELSKSLGISASVAKSIVDYRTKNGPYGKMADLKAVPNIDWKAIESQSSRIEFLK